MIETRLHEQLHRVGRRIRRQRLAAVMALVWLLAALLGGGLWLAGRFIGPLPSWTVPALAIAGLLSTLIATWLVLRRPIGPLDTARRVEASYPELQAKLLTAAEQRRDDDQARLGYLQTMVVGEAAAHGRRTGWKRVAPSSRAILRGGQLCAALALFVAMLGLLLVDEHHAAGLRPSIIGALPPGMKYDVAIEPGDTELERGSSLLVLARFRGTLASEVKLVHQPAIGGQAETLPLAKSLDDPVFAGRVANVQSDLTYRVEYAGQQSPTYRVTVFDYPELERSDIKLAFPSYTGQPETLVEDARQVTAVEGTKLTFIARLNKEVSQARLVGEGAPIELAVDPQQKQVYTATWPLVKTGRYKLELVDRQGRKNKEPPDFSFTVVPNRRPELKLVFPSRDVQVSPLEELELQASVWDDFGILAYGMAYSFDGQSLKEIVLGEKAPGKERRDARQLVSFESLSAKPDQLLSYYFFADDAGPDGKLRRTLSDMFFCEVRPFEEIFRQGEPPPGGSSQPAGNDADKLADLQKQVINATWKLIRRETLSEPTAEFAADVAQVLAGEQEVLQMAAELEPKLRSPESRAALQLARKQMNQALTQLQQAVDGPKIPPLVPALAAEQAAYQALLKLRAREHEITRNSKSPGGGGGGNRSQQELNELELKESENRYEQQRTADKSQDEAQRETRQVLNRLRELAQRQGDLNKQIAELQSALEAAQTPQEQEEIRRQLKRLRDEEEQILRDADELRNRMQQPANQQRMADAQRQLDQTRSNVRRASEALAEGKASQAAAAGSRAEKQLSDLREQFRKQAAGRFQDEMRELRDESKQMLDREQELGRQVTELDKPQEPSLRPQSGREQLSEKFGEQRQRLDKLVDEMRKTVEEAKTTEPLLSKQLYDTIRQTHQGRTGETLDVTRQLLERGFVAEAAKAEEAARAGVGRLHEGIERAAQSVLGDENEALRRARDAVDELAQALDQEIDRASGKQRVESGEPKAESVGQAGKTQGGQGRPGEKEAPSGKDPGGERGGQQKEEAGGEQQAAGGKGAEGNQQGGSRQGNPNGRGGVGNLLDRVGGFSSGPLTGGGFRHWADELRDVEEMLNDPQLRAEAARIRDRASAMRAEFIRHSKEPNWDLVRAIVSKPLAELRKHLAEEILKQQSKDALVPLDRDPVPPKYSEQVRRYYERLGSGR